MIGEKVVRHGQAPTKRVVLRIRTCIVMQTIIHFVGRVTGHARQLILFISRSNAWNDCFLSPQSQSALLVFHGFKFIMFFYIVHQPNIKVNYLFQTIPLVLKKFEKEEKLETV